MHSFLMCPTISDQDAGDVYEDAVHAEIHVASHFCPELLK